MPSGRLAHACRVMPGGMHTEHHAIPSSWVSASRGERERQTSCTGCELQEWHLCSTLCVLGLQRARPGRALQSRRKTRAASVMFCASSSVRHSLPSPSAHLLLLDLSVVHPAKRAPCTRCQVTMCMLCPKPGTATACGSLNRSFAVRMMILAALSVVLLTLGSPCGSCTM